MWKCDLRCAVQCRPHAYTIWPLHDFFTHSCDVYVFRTLQDKFLHKGTALHQAKPSVEGGAHKRSQLPPFALGVIMSYDPPCGVRGQYRIAAWRGNRVLFLSLSLRDMLFFLGV